MFMGGCSAHLSVFRALWTVVLQTNPKLCARRSERKQSPCCRTSLQSRSPRSCCWPQCSSYDTSAEMFRHVAAAMAGTTRKGQFRAGPADDAGRTGLFKLTPQLTASRQREETSYLHSLSM